MSFYEAVRVYKEKKSVLTDKINLKTILKHICCFGLGVLFSLSGLSNGFSPFGIAYTGGVSRKYVITAVLGSVIGYFISLDSVNALRYTSTVLALCVIKLSLKSLKVKSDDLKISVIISFVCVLTTGIAVTLSQGFTFLALVTNLCESALCGAVTYVFIKSKTYLTLRCCLKTLTSREITFVIISFTILLLSFRYVNFFSISFVNIISVFLILLCSYYGREAGGSVVGISCGISSLLGGGGLLVLAFYSLGGLLSGVVSSYGRLLSFLSFILSGALVYITSGSDESIPHFVIEALLGGFAFFVISIRFDYTLNNFFTPAVSSPIINSVKNNIMDKLHRASEFSTEICTTLDNVNDALSKSNKANYNSIPQKVKETVCYNCGLYDTCWGEQKNNTIINFKNLLELKKCGEYLQYKTLPQGFASSCIKTENIVSYFNKLYSEYKLHEKTESRFKEIQTLASEQFINVSDLLLSLCDEINEEVCFDMDIAARCKAVAISCGAEVVDSCCTFDSLEKLTIELRLKSTYDTTVLRSLNAQICSVTGKALEEPDIEKFGDYVRLIYKEKAEYKTIVSSVQYNAPGEKFSGDTFTTFTDDKGFFYCIICDGMGTGPNAAVTSGLAVNLLQKLLKAGFGILPAINTVNTSLISKSGNECSVTLDLLCLDLYTGRAEFYKCGAQDTLVRHKGKITNVNTESLPLGIISDIEVGTLCCNLCGGDVLILCSDGVREEDFYSLRNALKVFEKGNVKDFTDDIADTIRRSQPEKKDDFTMITIAISNNR